MSYNVNIAGQKQNVSSYAAAVNLTRDLLRNTADNIRNGRLFRSPKVRSTLAAAVESVALPKKAGNVAFNINGLVPVRIEKA